MNILDHDMEGKSCFRELNPLGHIKLKRISMVPVERGKSAKVIGDESAGSDFPFQFVG